jgi:hypothetical protein
MLSLLRAVAFTTKAHELPNVAAVETGCVVEDPCRGLEPRVAVLREPFVSGPDRLANFSGDLFTVHEERCHRQAHVVASLSPMRRLEMSLLRI